MKLISKIDLLDLALQIKHGDTVLTEEDVTSERVFLIISSLRARLEEPNNGNLIQASKIISKHIRLIGCIQDAANFPPDIPKE